MDMIKYISSSLGFRTYSHSVQVLAELPRGMDFVGDIIAAVHDVLGTARAWRGP